MIGALASIGGKLASAAEELAQAVNDRIAVVTDLVDEASMSVVVEVPNEMSRERSVVEESVEESPTDRDLA